MPLYVMIQIRREVRRQVVGHPAKILQCLPERGRQLGRWLDAGDRARRPRDVSRKHYTPGVSQLDNGHVTRVG